MERLNSGKKNHLQNHFLYCHHWSDEKWQSSMAGGGGQKKIFQYCSDSSGTILYLRALQGHSGLSLIQSFITGHVIFPDGFFKYIHHVGCAIKLRSIINSGLIPGGQNFEQQTDRILSACGSLGQKNTRNPDTIDFEAPRLAKNMHKAWKKHQNTVY